VLPARLIPCLLRGPFRKQIEKGIDGGGGLTKLKTTLREASKRSPQRCVRILDCGVFQEFLMRVKLHVRERENGGGHKPVQGSIEKNFAKSSRLVQLLTKKIKKPCVPREETARRFDFQPAMMESIKKRKNKDRSLGR